MMIKKDNIFESSNFNDLPFSFNEEVTEVFEDMIDRSVPGYRSSLKIIEELGKRYFKDGTSCYDLGCSLGGATLSLLSAIQGREGKIYAVDKSNAMISACNKKFTNFKKVYFLNQDIEATEIKDASIVVLNFVLQFLDTKKRNSLLDKVFSGMRKGGLLVLSEKIHFDNELRNKTLFNLHHNFKFKNGYTQMEISRKRDALEGVLVTDLEEDHNNRLKKLGFRNTRKVMSNLNFLTLISEK
ncbi:MAG: carboxy-S-adenosyl-L-methionine synthase CmoA [Gammaproteobacteria bacterium]|nr:carboxy-S-adenosyl-L-methionine synthase CmoA [Gammaproteobacteria bacterium]